MPGKYCVVLVTAPNRNTAQHLTHALLRERAAACVSQMHGLESSFWWKGAIDRAEETLLIIKTRKDRFKKVTTLVSKHHPYEVPEILALPVLAGHAPYLKWLDLSLKPKAKRRKA